MITLKSNSLEDTEKIAQKVAANLKGDEVIALYGGLGMGKTAFTRGLCLALGCEDNISSPTFALVNEYKGKNISLYHFDMYRISGEDDLESTGFYDYPFEDNIVAVEWSENIADFLPENTIYITISRIDDDTREIIIENGGKYAAAWN